MLGLISILIFFGAISISIWFYFHQPIAKRQQSNGKLTGILQIILLLVFVIAIINDYFSGSEFLITKKGILPNIAGLIFILLIYLILARGRLSQGQKKNFWLIFIVVTIFTAIIIALSLLSR